MSCAQVPCHQIRAFGRSAEASSALELSDRHPINSSCSAGGSSIVPRFDNRPPRQLARRRRSWSQCSSFRALRVRSCAMYPEPSLQSGISYKRIPAFTDEKAQPRAPSVYASLLADRASHPRARAPTRGAGLARSFIPWIRLLGFRIAHAGVVSAPTKAA